MEKKYQTINTFTRAPSPAQIVSYNVIVLEIIVFYALVMNMFANQTVKIIFIALYSFSVVMLFGSTIYCSISDPSDSTMIAYKNGNKDTFSSRMTQLLYCDYCQSYVQMNSRHCRQCSRCVQNFDHHCMWINNCIGSKNYKIFIVMIISTCSNMLIFLISVLVLSLQNNWSQFIGQIITSWVVCFIVLILTILLFNLILLHIYLMCKGYTTYQFIIARRQQQRIRKLEQQQKQAQKNRQQRIKKQKSTFSLSKNRAKTIIDQQIISGNNASIMHQEHSSYDSHKQTPAKLLNQNTNTTKINTNSDQNLQTTNQPLKDQKAHENLEQNVKQFYEGSDNIFGENDQKSQAISVKIQDEQILDQNKGSEAKMNDIQQNMKKVHKSKIKRQSSEEYVENTDEQQQQIRMSHFFTRNKSLSLLIGQDLATKPKKKISLNVSCHNAHDIKNIKNQSNKLIKSDMHRINDHKTSQNKQFFKDKDINFDNLNKLKVKSNQTSKKNPTIQQEDLR